MTDTHDGSGEGSSAIVSDLGNISINIVGVVVDVLDPSVREVDGVVALPGSGAIVRLLGVKTGSRVVVGHSMAHYSMPDSNSMANTHSMAESHAVAKANTMANSSKKLSRGSSHKSGERDESLHVENCCH